MITNEERELLIQVSKGIKPISAIPKSLLNTEGVKEGIKDLLEHEGITLVKLNKRLKEQLNAKKVIYHDPKLIKEEVPDWDNRDKALTKGYKLYGVLKDTPDNYVDNRQITFNGDPNQLLKVVQEMKELKAKAIIDTSGEVI